MSTIRQHLFRTLLFFHFVGLAATLGGRFAIGVIEGYTRAGQLPTVLLGRNLIDVSQRLVILPGFLAVLATGVALTLTRYRLRPPLWVWIKVGLVLTMTAIGVFGVGPAAAAAQQAARWSAAHGQLTATFVTAVQRSNFFGGIVRALFLLTVAVAVWKPFGSVGRRKTRRKEAAVLSTSDNEAQRTETLI